MTGLEYILITAFVAVVAVAVWAVYKWIDYAMANNILRTGCSKITDVLTDQRNRFHNLYVTALNACIDLDLQVSDYRVTITQNNIDLAILDIAFAAYRLAHPVTCKRGKDGRFVKVNQFADDSKTIEKPIQMQADCHVGDGFEIKSPIKVGVDIDVPKPEKHEFNVNGMKQLAESRNVIEPAEKPLLTAGAIEFAHTIVEHDERLPKGMTECEIIGIAGFCPMVCESCAANPNRTDDE